MWLSTSIYCDAARSQQYGRDNTDRRKKYVRQ